MDVLRVVSKGNNMQNPLKAKLEKLGINTLQLSRAIGLNWHYTTQIINGNRTPSANVGEKIDYALKLDMGTTRKEQLEWSASLLHKVVDRRAGK